VNNQPAHPDLSFGKLCGLAIRYALRRPGALLLVVGSLLFNVLLTLLKPWPMAFLIDYVLRAKPMPPALAHWVGLLPGSSSPSSLVGWSVAATILLFLLSWVAGVTAACGNISLGQRMTYDLAADLFTKLQQLSLHFHARKSVGDNLRRVTTDSGCLAIIVKDALLPVGSSAVTLLLAFAVLWRIDATLTAWSLAVVPLMLLAFARYARPMMEGSYAQQEAEGKIYEVIEQTFSAIPVVQAFGREDFHDRQFGAVTENALAATLGVTRVQLYFKVLVGLATALGTGAILWIGSRHALAGALEIGSIVAFLYYLSALYAPIETIAYTGSTIQGAAGSARRVWEILQTETRVADQPGATTLPRPRGRIQFENVSFGYEPDRPVLEAISLTVEPGETIAFVGVTGAGKSTLVSLVPRFFDPWEGRILIDDKDARTVTLKSLRQHISIVLQEPFLFPMTVAENIAYGRPEAAQAEVEAAARAANAHDFITRLPLGYQTVVGERGATLSGGERQRLSIARALLKDAPILILDEPTSSLDAETENALLEALDRLTANRTTFIIAHRLSTVRRASRIVALENGRIAEIGTQAELLARGGVYARFHQLSSSARTENHP